MALLGYYSILEVWVIGLEDLRSLFCFQVCWQWDPDRSEYSKSCADWAQSWWCCSSLLLASLLSFSWESWKQEQMEPKQLAPGAYWPGLLSGCFRLAKRSIGFDWAARTSAAGPYVSSDGFQLGYLRWWTLLMKTGVPTRETIAVANTDIGGNAP